MEDLIELIKSKIPVLLILAGGAMVFFGVLEKDPNGGFRPYDSPSVWALSAGGAFVILATFMLFFRDQLAPYERLQGLWEYEVFNADNTFSHMGCCRVTQNQRKIKIEGRRKIAAKAVNGNSTLRPSSESWGTDWAEICDDHTLRFDYHVHLTEGIVEATCRVHIPSKKPESMQGSYFILPPAPDGSLLDGFGRLHMQRTKDRGKNTKFPLKENYFSELKEEEKQRIIEMGVGV